MFARDRSINFCRLRTFEVPRLRRREDPLPQTPYFCLDRPPVDRPPSRAGRPPVRSPPRPQPPRVVQLVLRFRRRRHRRLSQAHLTRVSTLSGPGTTPGIRPVIHDRRQEEASTLPRFPVAFRPPAFASRVILFPPGIWAFLTVGLPATISSGRTPTGLPRSTRTRCDRGGCPLYPGDGGALPAGMPCPAGACRFPAASPCTPPAPSHRAGLTHDEASTKGSRDSPVRSSPHP